jgi:twitching motility protein PilT
MILDPEQTDRLREVIAEGEFYGMQTFDQALLHHYQAGSVSMDDAMRVASSPHDFKLLVAGEGRTSTSMGDLEGGGQNEASPSPATLLQGSPAQSVASAVGPSPPPAPLPAPSNGRPSSPPPGLAA